MDDRISKMPDNILGCIVSRLSLKDAVRTSILSTAWRYIWTSIPCLVFDDQSAILSMGTLDQIQTLVNDSMLPRLGKLDLQRRLITKELVIHVDRILLPMNVGILKFKLSHPHLNPVGDIDRWILHLSRHPCLQELSLKFWCAETYTIPSCIYQFKMLVNLTLEQCFLKPPPLWFNGFLELNTLTFQGGYMEQSQFEQMILKCPKLERLIVKGVDGIYSLNVHSRSLIYLEFEGKIDFVKLHGTSKLAYISFSIWNLTKNWRESSCKFNAFFASLSKLQRLTVDDRFLQYLACGTIPTSLSASCPNLTFVSICIDLYDKAENMAAHWILTNSPKLQELELHGLPFLYPIKCEDGFLKNVALNQLRVVKIDGIYSGSENHHMIKFLLRNAPGLEKVYVRLGKGDNDDVDLTARSLLKLQQKLKAYPRASGSAKIFISKTCKHA